MLILVLGLLPLPAAAKDNMNLVLTLSRADLQRRVERLFPIRREDALVSVVLSRPEVMLREGSNRIGLRLHIEASALQQQQLTTSGTVGVDGVLRFLNSSGEFYLDDASVEELRLGQVPPLYLDEVRQLADGLVRDLLEERPIYVLGQSGESTRIMGSELKAVAVRDGRVVVELSLP
jgi:hypothetical protein